MASEAPRIYLRLGSFEVDDDGTDGQGARGSTRN